MIGGIIANFAPAVYIYLAYGLIPPIPDIIKTWTVCAVTFGISWVIQPITYFSLLGPSGEYIGWLAGSNADIRCPSVAMAQKTAGRRCHFNDWDCWNRIYFGYDCYDLRIIGIVHFGNINAFCYQFI